MTAESTVNAIMDQLLDSKFEAFIDRFTDNNCSTFTDDAEFKLGYTDIHQQYVRLLVLQPPARRANQLAR